mmetsp:Transcript_3156/g.5979  ORF Transcript_3156/g.5979 Transcript_3156/m.5979 type:complete len:310 (+) Transcript_3156:855-1784(+)
MTTRLISMTRQSIGSEFAEIVGKEREKKRKRTEQIIYTDKKDQGNKPKEMADQGNKLKEMAFRGHAKGNSESSQCEVQTKTEESKRTTRNELRRSARLQKVTLGCVEGIVKPAQASPLTSKSGKEEPGRLRTRDSFANLTAVLAKLGETMPQTGKAPVMSLAGSGQTPRFNVFEGLVEWRNAMFLWINLDSHTAPYANVFYSRQKDELAVVWYASAKYTTDHPSIQRLVTHRQSDTPVLLFTRRTTQSPYIVCGRLEYQSHREAVSPLPLLFRLMDYPKLKSSFEFLDLLEIAVTETNPSRAPTWNEKA